MRRLLAILFLPLIGCVHSPEGPGQFFATGRLIELPPKAFDCGVLSVASTAKYTVIDGPASLQGREINVLIGCIEMGRERFSDDAGDLKEFVVGDTHHLVLAKNAPEFDHVQGDAAVDFYLAAASLATLRPN